MVITIGGCRDFNYYKMFSNCMKEYLKTIDDLKNIVFLSGHCSGADEMVERFAFENQISLETFPADWKKYGKAAGPKRNKEMIEKCDIVIAFWDGVSKGTKNLIETAKKNGVDVVIFDI